MGRDVSVLVLYVLVCCGVVFAMVVWEINRCIVLCSILFYLKMMLLLCC